MSKSNKLSINHAAGIFADMSVDGPAIGTLVAVIDRAKNLPNRKTMGKQNPYCAARLGKEAKKTETDMRGGQTPRWDQELRFTVHESPDYLRLKVSVFNDDKRTDMIGETWVGLKDLIIPGGSQSDQWHPLQFRGKYAGEIRIEMTYYDTRPEDEAVIERRTQAADKIVAKSSSSSLAPSAPAMSGSSSLSGPRQLKDVKRRPLPSDPTGAAARPSLPEKVPSAPLPVQPPLPRPVQEPVYAPRQAPELQEPVVAPVPLRPARNYEFPDDSQREWHPTQIPPSSQIPPSLSRRQPQEYAQPHPAHDPRVYARPHSGYSNMPPADFAGISQPPRLDYYQPEPDRRVEAPRPTSNHANYPFSTTEQYPPGADATRLGQVARFPPRGSVSVHEHAPLEYAPVDNPLAPMEVDRLPYRAPVNSLTEQSRPPPSRDGYHAEYATMQPRVEDEEEEEGPPPPPPVHRSGVVGANQQLVPSPRSSYQAYSLEYGAPPRSSHDLRLSHSSHDLGRSRPSHEARLSHRTSNELRRSHPPQLRPDGTRLTDLPPPTNAPHMPPSLVAGFDPVVADDESDRMAYEGEARRRSSYLEERQVMMPEPEPAVSLPPYPVNPSVEDGAVVVRRGSANTNMQMVPLRKSVSPQPLRRQSVSPHPAHRQSVSPHPVHRKSVSPHPVQRKSVSPQPPVGEREGGQIPFSPDSYDLFNPNAARAAVVRDPHASYDTPAQAMEAAQRSEQETARGPTPIIGDDGKEIDPSDHLPTDTWAPEPERKPKKPGLVVRFRNTPRHSPAAPPPTVPPKKYIRPALRPQSYLGGGSDPPAEPDRGRSRYGYHNKSYSTPNVAAPYGGSARGRSPGLQVGYAGHTRGHSPGGHSPGLHVRGHSPGVHARGHSPGASMYAPPPTVGPPIPAKVPVGPPTKTSTAMVAPGGMDALSRELNTIDIGEVGFNHGRAMRRYVPRLTTGYAS
ncbi:hypothetical protein P168DRAFT_325500 [Aspergillus campestris IBT 28561]|uniref:C2 domain-containing protein n=1 Tax=Aspergillus campestris (strain IBT 28561) TaxID=1392248 RepID=A0A2I1D9W3_ASPC2|nr:uncharacterized protein P168DRAFT_325500 [Aspergillus campestris IBT 28561]PKY06656.1 hypothetical protein P168DRAFT_325500 [Aspergillus campestris IBT 28561]